jgi:hypothetical protein
MDLLTLKSHKKSIFRYKLVNDHLKVFSAETDAKNRPQDDNFLTGVENLMSLFKACLKNRK